MVYAIGFFALFVALVGLWLNSETLKKVDAGNEALVKSHIKAVKDALVESNKAVNALAIRVAALEKELAAAKAAQAKARETLAGIERRAKSQPQPQQDPAAKPQVPAAVAIGRDIA